MSFSVRGIDLIIPLPSLIVLNSVCGYDVECCEYPGECSKAPLREPFLGGWLEVVHIHF